VSCLSCNSGKNARRIEPKAWNWACLRASKCHWKYRGKARYTTAGASNTQLQAVGRIVTVLVDIAPLALDYRGLI
jgi:hypothetical protein